MSTIRDQITDAALEHGARAVLSAPSLAARVVRVWVYVWLTPAVLALLFGLACTIDHGVVHYPMIERIGASFAVSGMLLFFWFFPSMAATGVGMIIVAAFRYK